MRETTLPICGSPVSSSSSAEEILAYGVYQIATGKWAPGERLPSVRDAERKWAVERRVISRAYRELVRRGLVINRPRSGYYVAESKVIRRMSRHRHELDRLFERFAAEVATTKLSTVGVFHYFARLAAIRAETKPECAFVECSYSQAAGHAREIQERLGTACLPLVTHEVEGQLSRIPQSVRTLLVSAFHISEFQQMQETAQQVAVVSVPVALDPGLAGELPADCHTALVLETDAMECQNILADIEGLELPVRLEGRTVSDVNRALTDMFADDAGNTAALLRPRLWGALAPDWRRHSRVLEARFRIAPSAWDRIADAIGMPLGDLN